MNESICGKNCEGCAMGAELGCPGCKGGPGSALYGDCAIAKCCHEKDCGVCADCPKGADCLELAAREHVPTLRKARHAAKVARKAVMDKRAPFLGKWLWVLFWLNILSLLNLSSLFEEGTAIYAAFTWLGLLLSLVMALILLVLGREENHYKIAGWIYAGLVLHQALVTLFTVNGEEPLWAALTLLISPLFEMYGMYRFLSGHAAVTDDVDPKLSKGWLKLRTWYLVVQAVIYGSMFFTAFMPMVAAIVIAVSAVALVVVGIVDLVYLYRSAQAFRKYKG